MPLPGNVDTITVTGTYVDMSGAPLSGTVTFVASVNRLRDPDADVIITDYPFVATLDGSGSFSIELPATDDSDLVPSPWYYRVTENLNDHRETFFMEVPQSSPGGVLDMADADRAVKVPNVITYASRGELLNHLADTTGVHGIVDTADLETQSGATAKASAASISAINAAAASASTLYVRKDRLWKNVKDYGATGDGTTDDTAAFAAAFTAAGNGGRVYMPKPAVNYKTSSPLTVPMGCTLEGDGAYQTLINNSASTVFTSSGYWSFNTFRHFGVNASGGHIFAPAAQGASVCEWTNLDLNQSNINYCVYANNVNVGANTFIANLVSECRIAGNSAGTHTVPLWRLISSGSNINQNRWESCTFYYSGNYCVWIEETAANWCYDNVFSSCLFEVTNGGNIKLLSANSCIIESCVTYDLQAIGPTTRDLYHVGKSTGNSSTLITFRQANRRGGTLGGGLVDIKLQASACSNITFEQCATGTGGLSIDAGLVAGVRFRGCPSTTTVTNPGVNVGWSGTESLADTPIANIPHDGAGQGSPEGVLTAAIGSTYRQTNGTAAGTLWVKVSGTGNTGWVAIPAIYSGSATLDFPSIAAGGQQELDITVTGAVSGDCVALGIPSGINAGLVFNAYVVSSNTVRVRASNITGSAIDPGSVTFKARVIK